MASLRSRQSIFPQALPAESYFDTLDNCSQALHKTSTHCFDVVTETEVSRAQRDLASEIEPQIKELIELAETGLEELKGKEKHLRARLEKRTALSTASRQATAAAAAPPVDLKEKEKQLAALRRQKMELSRVGSRLDTEIGRLKRTVGAK
ncbi:mitotic spindle biogenesis protein Spc19 [Pseudohyphozyma bogoriensis]|nr:mitotic spindle biogenesis protein Spc19 [Pseudohyphozyma bogoriensis]